MITPTRPPWNDMPPCQVLRIEIGSLEILARFVEQHVTEASAEDDAAEHPQEEVVHLLLGHQRGRVASPASACTRRPRTGRVI